MGRRHNTIVLIPTASMIDLSIAGLIVAFSSSMTYGIIQWFRRVKNKKGFSM
ncbi:MAG TPA: hypothetical protein VHK86_08190 [Nitrososphaera sp.]|nr:hypothetical protein [Nitrososphaera sp.]